MDEIDIRFTEREVAQILWVLSEAADLVNTAQGLSNLAMIEDTLRMGAQQIRSSRPRVANTLDLWLNA